MTKTTTATTHKPARFALIFDGGGGITLQSARYAHYYDQPTQAAADVRTLLASGTTIGWEGHEPASRIDLSEDHCGLRVLDADDVRARLDGSARVGADHVGRAERALFAALGVVTRDDPRYVASDDPRAVLRAWGGAEGNVNMDFGGWTDADETAFRAAVQDESLFGGGARLSCIVVKPVRESGE